MLSFFFFLPHPSSATTHKHTDARHVSLPLLSSHRLFSCGFAFRFFRCLPSFPFRFLRSIDSSSFSRFCSNPLFSFFVVVPLACLVYCFAPHPHPSPEFLSRFCECVSIGHKRCFCFVLLLVCLPTSLHFLFFSGFFLAARRTSHTHTHTHTLSLVKRSVFFFRLCCLLRSARTSAVAFVVAISSPLSTHHLSPALELFTFECSPVPSL